MQIRKAQASDGPAILEIILPVIREGATYSLDPDLSAADALAYWMSHDKETFVAEDDNVIVGTYFIRPNQAGGGRHVCNCGYITRTDVAGRGVARGMCQHSLKTVRILDRCDLAKLLLKSAPTLPRDHHACAIVRWPRGRRPSY